jgi:serine/threonine protein kinase
MREIHLCMGLDDPNIISLLGITRGFRGASFPSLVFRWMPEGDLDCYIAYHGAGIDTSVKLSVVCRLDYFLPSGDMILLVSRHCLWSHLPSVLCYRQGSHAYWLDFPQSTDFLWFTVTWRAFVPDIYCSSQYSLIFFQKNVLLGPENRAYLTGFSSSTVLDGMSDDCFKSPEKPQPGRVQFTAPECFAEGGPSLPSVKRDIYSFGYILFHVSIALGL